MEKGFPIASSPGAGPKLKGILAVVCINIQNFLNSRTNNADSSTVVDSTSIDDNWFLVWDGWIQAGSAVCSFHL